MTIGARTKPWICSAQSRDKLVSAVSICVGVTNALTEGACGDSPSVSGSSAQA
jgi:hypothetical protein